MDVVVVLLGPVRGRIGDRMLLGQLGQIAQRTVLGRHGKPYGRAFRQGYWLIRDERLSIEMRSNDHIEHFTLRLRRRNTEVHEFGAPIGDNLNGDCSVSLHDPALFLAHFGTPSGATHGDGDVDLSDLATLLANFGSTCP